MQARFALRASTWAIVLSLNLGCGGGAERMRVAPLRAEAEAALAGRDLQTALTKYRRAWTIANVDEADTPGAGNGLRERIQETQLAITRLRLDRLDALVTTDPRAAADAFLVENSDSVKAWWDSDSWYALRSPKAEADGAALPTVVLRTDRYSEAGAQEVYARVKKGYAAAAAALLARVCANEEHVALGDSDFLLRVVQGWGTPELDAMRKTVAKRIAAQAEAEKTQYPSLAQWHQRVARHYDPSLPAFEATDRVAGLAWHVHAEGGCAEVTNQFRKILEGVVPKRKGRPAHGVRSRARG